MKLDFFQFQIQRLQTRFGTKAFDQEFSQLVWREVHDMSEPGFVRTVDIFIGSRSTHKPPLLSEFREARLNEKKLKFQNDLRGATEFLTKKAPAEMRKHLKAILSKEFGGVESVSDAFEVARMRVRAENAKNEPEPEGAA